jgi:DNA-binding PadR family transcriptional regulator
MKTFFIKTNMENSPIFILKYIIKPKFKNCYDIINELEKYGFQFGEKKELYPHILKNNEVTIYPILGDLHVIFKTNNKQYYMEIK